MGGGTEVATGRWAMDGPSAGPGPGRPFLWFVSFGRAKEMNNANFNSGFTRRVKIFSQNWIKP